MKERLYQNRHNQLQQSLLPQVCHQHVWLAGEHGGAGEA